VYNSNVSMVFEEAESIYEFRNTIETINNYYFTQIYIVIFHNLCALEEKAISLFNSFLKTLLMLICGICDRD
jgi:hypothetical protein